MIDLYYAATPNGLKVKLLLEEVGVPYKIIPINLQKGEQFNPEFLAISPNNKIPAIVDHHPSDGGAPLSLFESGAILLYMAEKERRFLPAKPREMGPVFEWLFWQVSELGPMSGQLNYFNTRAPEKVPFAIERYKKEVERLYAVLERRLSAAEFLAGEYSIADIACYPWIALHASSGQDLNAFPNIKRWFGRISEREAVKRVYQHP